MKKTKAILLFSIVAVLAVATGAHRFYGSSVAVDLVYHAWWFIVLWIVLISVEVFGFIRQHKFTKPIVCFHAAAVCVLIGSLVTFFTAEKGTLHLRTGAGTSYFLDDKSSDCYRFPFQIKLDRFEVKRNPETQYPTDYVSRVTIVDQQKSIRKTIAVNDPVCYDGYRFLQGEYDYDQSGVTIIVNHDPWGMWLVYGGYLLFMVGAIWWFIAWSEYFRLQNRLLSASSRWILKGILLITLLIIPSVVTVQMELDRESMPPVLLSSWLKPHVWSITAAYSLFFCLLLNALLAEVWYHKGNAGKVVAITEVSKLMLYPAVILLGIGICLGSVWANDSWGAYWSWDPKEVWALITFLVYSVALHHDIVTGLQQPTLFHRYFFFTFLSVVLTYWGVNCFLGGMHSYA